MERRRICGGSFKPQALSVEPRKGGENDPAGASASPGRKDEFEETARAGRNSGGDDNGNTKWEKKKE